MQTLNVGFHFKESKKQAALGKWGKKRKYGYVGSSEMLWVSV